MKGRLGLVTGDATKLELPDNSVDLIITHPPYIGTDVERYGGDPAKQINSSQNEKKYLKLLLKATKEMDRVLKDSGHLVIANFSRNGFDAKFLTQTIKKTNFKFVDYFVQASEGRLTIWQHYQKSNMAYVNRDKLREIGQTWNLPFNNMDSEIDLQLEKEGFHVLDVMNRGIPENIINIYSVKDQVVLDPFGGSAMVAVTAVGLGRIGISNDISDQQTRAAERRADLSQ